MPKLNAYIDFKTRQHIRLTGFDVLADGAKEKLSAEVAPLLRGWVAEFIAASK